MYEEEMLTVVELKKRSDLHLARKIWHMTGVYTMYLAYTYLPEAWSYTLLFLGWFLFVPFDFLRQKKSEINEWAVHAFRPIMRQSEATGLAGTTYLLTGVVLLVLFFPRPIVSMALLFLAFADPIASFVGIKYGKDKIFGHKSIQGFFAAFTTCTLISVIYLNLSGLDQARLWVVSLLSGFIGALAELIPIGKLDDNLTLPLLSAIGLSVLFYFFGILSIVG